ncbi:hypothetical protein [Rhodococcus sp. USK13]|uniref:hypothetical protein n=1 Tax=Rhodococcus sp. USK13 TaxID=2806442 RepID=UPI0020177BF3|nr:hypothetical protein [Rhodococcus sp. USK13]
MTITSTFSDSPVRLAEHRVFVAAGSFQESVQGDPHECADRGVVLGGQRRELLRGVGFQFEREHDQRDRPPHVRESPRFGETVADGFRLGDQSSAGGADQRPEPAWADALGHLLESVFGLGVEAQCDGIAHRDPPWFRLRHPVLFFWSAGAHGCAPASGGMPGHRGSGNEWGVLTRTNTSLRIAAVR